jgi:excinuclease ABC subunit A
MSKVLKSIQISGANEHNLKNIDVSIPRDNLVVITGVSGSGKSSLAFETIFAEGQRKYMESLSSYARQFLTQMNKPDVESIEGLPPTIAIAQRSASHNPRSTVATTTEIYDYLRLLMARCGTPHCWHTNKKGKVCGKVIESTTITQIINTIAEIPEGTKLLICAPVVVGKKGYHRDVLEDLRSQGFVRARVNGKIVDLREILIDESENPLSLGRYEMNTIEAVVDRLVAGPDLRERIADSVEITAKLSSGSIIVLSESNGEWVEQRYSEHFACPDHPQCSISELEPRLFSFNSHFGACKRCDGLGKVHEFDPNQIVPDESLPITKGAIAPWHKAGPAVRRKYGRQLRKFCEMVKVEKTSSYSSLSKGNKKLLLYGGSKKGSRTRFTGVIPVLEKRFKITESDNVRSWLMGYMAKQVCPECRGERIRVEARSVSIESDKGQHSISELTSMTIGYLHQRLQHLKLNSELERIAEPVIREIYNRLTFLVSVGLDYLSLDRTSGSLSGGEAQRIRLATQVGSGLVGVCYVLDEPTIGLHARDTKRLLATLSHLTDIGNTVLIVEHDEELIRNADHLIDVGPLAGIHGGEIIAQGTVTTLQNNNRSITGKYLAKKLCIEPPIELRTSTESINILDARKNNLKEISVEIPLGILTCVTGVSGSGKSSLVNGVLLEGVKCKLQKKKIPTGLCKSITNTSKIDRLIEVNQSPIGRTPRSNPATYTGIFDGIRALFSQTRESKIRGYKQGRFSFNVKGGRCESCQGQGVKRIEMHFLPDAFVTCEECDGRRYNSETLEIKWRGYTISDILNSTIEDALSIFANHKKIERMLQCLIDVGLGYLTLGQPSTTLSGGEAQRVKLASELGLKTNNHTLYILDEPTTGLHFADIQKLIEVIQRLVSIGNSVVVIEHNMDVIKCADWIIDLGPEGGDSGGFVVASGTPKQISSNKKSFTGIELSK